MGANSSSPAGAPPAHPANSGDPTAIPGDVPEPDELGRAGWTILHATAAVFPNHPTAQQQEHLRAFIHAWSNVYPCSHCAYHMRQALKKYPPVVTDKREASRYICVLHNKVNKVLAKPQYDCDPDVVLRRWHPTYPNMEDVPSIEEQLAEAAAQAAATASARPQPKPQAPQQATPASSASSRWRDSSPGLSAAAVPSPTSLHAAAPPRAADHETDVDQVLARLKGCQVYCPEKKA